MKTTDNGTPLAMFDAQGVADRLRRWVPLGTRLASSWCETGRIIGVTAQGDRLYPACQFDAEGLPRVAMRDVIAALRPKMTEAEMLGWLGRACDALSGARPADRLADAPGSVIAAARCAAGEGRRSAA